jgi:hypothetical protein
MLANDPDAQTMVDLSEMSVAPEKMSDFTYVSNWQG